MPNRRGFLRFAGFCALAAVWEPVELGRRLLARRRGLYVERIRPVFQIPPEPVMTLFMKHSRPIHWSEVAQ